MFFCSPKKMQSQWDRIGVYLVILRNHSIDDSFVFIKIGAIPPVKRS